MVLNRYKNNARRPIYYAFVVFWDGTKLLVIIRVGAELAFVDRLADKRIDR